MSEIQCKCGKTKMTFRHMSQQDFPQGWETDCCLKAEKKSEPKAEKAPEEPKKAPEETKTEKPESDIKSERKRLRDERKARKAKKASQQED